MSEISLHQHTHVATLHQLYTAITSRQNAAATIRQLAEDTALVTPPDIIVFVHELVERGDNMNDIKLGINKLLNVTYKALSSFPYVKPAEGSYLDLCIKNNREMVRRMEAIRPVLIPLNKDLNNPELRQQFLECWLGIQPFVQYYVIKENVLFPLLEKHSSQFKCLSVMWSFHDDIRQHLDEMISYLQSNDSLELKKMNRLAGDLFFKLYAIRFREERILFPYMEQKIAPELIEALWNESVNLGFPYVNGPMKEVSAKEQHPTLSDEELNLQTGLLTLEQIIMIFNHLPIDITFVDENNKVRFFSTPPKRIFPRTTAIIGRDVNNCHPHESVHIVEKIVAAFKAGERDHADFWINMRGQKIMIQYFAVRDAKGNYRGVLEASQEISEIQALQGESRILDWK